jgi:GT2 family glycosyltransferase
MAKPESDAPPPAGVVVVLSWFGRSDTIECVRSLLQQPIPATVLVVDNGSFDGVLEEVAELWPRVATLQTGANLGYAGGMNRGIQWALERDAQFVTVLNNDTVIPLGVIDRTQDLARQRLAVSPEVFYRNEPTKVWFGEAALDPELMVPEHTPQRYLAATHDGLRQTELLAGCFITASASVWREVGLFDERFFLNFEDSDWSLRARAHGVDLVVDSTVSILHSVSASFVGDAATLSTFYFVRNGLLFNRLAGGSWVSRIRFLRHKALLVVTASMRAGDRRRATRLGVVVCWALFAHLMRRYGAAPRRLQRTVTRWNKAGGAARTPG